MKGALNYLNMHVESDMTESSPDMHERGGGDFGCSGTQWISLGKRGTKPWLFYRGWKLQEMTLPGSRASIRDG